MKFMFSFKLSVFKNIVMFCVASVLVFACSKHTKFDSAEWKANEESRFYMLDDIVNNKIFIGKSKRELCGKLGEPFIKEQDFYAGKKALLFRTSEKNGEYLHWYLFVELENDTVTYTQKSLD